MSEIAIYHAQVSGFRDQEQKSGLARIPLDIQGKSTTIWLWID
jgi:hypothetical protein